MIGERNRKVRSYLGIEHKTAIETPAEALPVKAVFKVCSHK